MGAALVGSWYKNSKSNTWSPPAPAAGAYRGYIFIQQHKTTNALTTDHSAYFAVATPPSYGGVQFTLLAEHLTSDTSKSGYVCRIWALNEMQLAQVSGSAWANRSIPNAAPYESNFAVGTITGWDQSYSGTPVKSSTAANATPTQSITGSANGLVLTAWCHEVPSGHISAVTFADASAVASEINSADYFQTLTASTAATGSPQSQSATASGDALATNPGYRIHELSIALNAAVVVADTTPPTLSGISVTSLAASANFSITSNEDGAIAVLATLASVTTSPTKAQFDAVAELCSQNIAKTGSVAVLLGGGSLPASQNYKLWYQARDNAASPNYTDISANTNYVAFATTAAVPSIQSISSASRGTGYMTCGEIATITLDSGGANGSGVTAVTINGIDCAIQGAHTGFSIAVNTPRGGLKPGMPYPVVLYVGAVASQSFTCVYTVPAGWQLIPFAINYSGLPDGSIVKNAAYSALTTNTILAVRSTTNEGHNLAFDEFAQVTDITSSGTTVADGSYATVGYLFDGDDGWSVPATNATFNLAMPEPPPSVTAPVLVAPDNLTVYVRAETAAVFKDFAPVRTWLNSCVSSDSAGALAVTHNAPDLIQVGSAIPVTFSSVNATAQSTVTRTVTLVATGSVGSSDAAGITRTLTRSLTR
jgi:hypothetical protein